MENKKKIRGKIDTIFVRVYNINVPEPVHSLIFKVN